MSVSENWTPISQGLPPRNARVDWISPTGEVVENGLFAGGVVWFLPGANPMYVYYTPTHWRLARRP